MMVSVKDMFTNFELKMIGLCILGLVYAGYVWYDLYLISKHTEDSQDKLKDRK